MQYFIGKVISPKIYSYELSPVEIYLEYREGRLLFFNRLWRLRYFIKETILLLLGRRHFVHSGEVGEVGLSPLAKVLKDLEDILRGKRPKGYSK